MNEYGEDSAGGEYDSRHDHASTDLAWVPPGWSEWFATGPTSTFGATDVYYWNYSVSDNGVVKNDPASGGGTVAEYSTNVWGAWALAHSRTTTSSRSRSSSTSRSRRRTGRAASPTTCTSTSCRRASAAHAQLGLRARDRVHVAAHRRRDRRDERHAGRVCRHVRRASSRPERRRRRGRASCKLEDLGEIDNTYVFYTSDHGFHLGQFAMIGTKDLPHDTQRAFFLLAAAAAERDAGAALGFAARRPRADVVRLGGDPSSIGRDAPGAPPFDGTSLLPMLGVAAVASLDIMEHQGQYSRLLINGGV